MSQTAQELIEGAGRLLSVNNMSAAELADALESLQVMLRGWSVDGINVEILTEITHTLTAGDAEYSIGSGGDIEADWPTEIMHAFVTVGGVDYPVKVIGEAAYDRISLKTIGGIPSRLFYKNSYPLGAIKLYYVPQSAYVLTMKASTMMDEPGALATEVTFAPYYDMAIKYNLAVHMAPEYGKMPSQIVIALALSSKAAIVSKNARDRTDPVELRINDGYHRATIEEG